jgi:hypothetical protein
MRVEGSRRGDCVALVFEVRVVFGHVVCRCGGFRKLSVRRHSGVEDERGECECESVLICRAKFDLWRVPTLLR